jgi:hypothetical protein
MSAFKDKLAPWIGVLAVLGFGAFVVFLMRRPQASAGRR